MTRIRLVNIRGQTLSTRLAQKRYAVENACHTFRILQSSQLVRLRLPLPMTGYV